MNIELNILKGSRHLCIIATHSRNGADVMVYRSLKQQLPMPYCSTKTIELTRERALRAIRKHIDKEIIDF